MVPSDVNLHVLEQGARGTFDPTDGRLPQFAGEVESRHTQARQDMTEAERAATSPPAAADLPSENHIVVLNGHAMASALADTADERPQVARLTGQELHAKAQPQLTRNDVLEAARDWFKANLQGRAVEREGFGPFRVSGTIKGGLTTDPEKARSWCVPGAALGDPRPDQEPARRG